MKLFKSGQKTNLILAFIVPALIMLVLFIMNGIFPFGDRCFLVSDMYHQYMPFFSEFLDKIKAGEGLSYSYQVGIGSNFLALYNYYLASPLHWLAFLFPKQYLIEFMSYLVIIKVGLCGFTFCYYLREHFKTEQLSTVLFSCLYALSGFMAAYNWNIMWLDCVILLPFILLGLERLVKENRCYLYCITLGLCIFTNFYISIMVCIFIVLYFLVLLVTEKVNFKVLRNFVVYSLLAGGMAAILLVPAVCALLETDFGAMDFPKEVKSYFSVLEMLSRHFMCLSTERGLDHWPNIYCGVAVFILLPMYALNDKISIRKRFGFLALTGFLLLSFSTNMLDFIWHGLNYPDSLPARQSFMYIFLILVMCYDGFRNMHKVNKKYILYSYLATVVFVLLCERFIEHEDFYFGIEWLTLAFVTVYAILLYLHRTYHKQEMTIILLMIGFVAVVAESGINTYNTSIGTTNRTQYLSKLEDYGKLTEQAQKEDSSFYRFEKFDKKTKNDGTLAGYPSASVFSSTMNSHVGDLYKRWGMRYSKVFYDFQGATPFTSALLNVRYMFDEKSEGEGQESKSEECSIFTLVGESGEVYLYECTAQLPFGYVAPTEYDLPTGYTKQPLRLQNKMVNALGIEDTLFKEVSSNRVEDNIKLEVEEDGYYYMEVSASGTSKIEMNSKEREFTGLKEGSVLYLGYLSAGNNVLLTNNDDSDETPKISLKAFKMDEDVLQEALEVLAQNSMTSVEYDSTHISGEIELQEAGRVILSIPYEHGWTVLLNGEKIEPALFGETLMALDLEAGKHTIQMSYIPYGKYVGIIMSIGSIAIFACIVFVSLWRKRAGAGEREIEGTDSSRGSDVSS